MNDRLMIIIVMIIDSEKLCVRFHSGFMLKIFHERFESYFDTRVWVETEK